MKPIALLASSVLLLTCVGYGLESSTKSDDSKAGEVAKTDVAKTKDVAAVKPSPKLVVHEWGTFTSFSGSDGIKLEFRPLLQNDLPGFVYNRARQSGNWLGKESLHALQRMETPVTYFYTPVERDVKVRVGFPDGLLTEFYPPVRKYGPVVKDFSAAYSEGKIRTQVPLKNSFLDWGKVHLIPAESLRAKVDNEELSRRIGKFVERQIVPSARQIHYAAARETDSAIIQFRNDDAADGNKIIPPRVDYFEKFLFYRGVGNFDLPLTLSEGENGAFDLKNAGEDSIRSLFLVNVRGETVRFRRFESIGPNSQLRLANSPRAQTVEALANAMVDALVGEGLYEKEARAMVKCWKSSWFGEEGTRLLYMVPARVTEELLPLDVEPRPDEFVRVLVGRMEIMSSAEEDRVKQLVATSLQARDDSAKSKKPALFRSPVLADLLAMGRLAEPALIRVRYLTDDESFQNETFQLVKELRDETKRLEAEQKKKKGA